MTVVCALQGCAVMFWPNTHQRIPELSGRVTLHGIPATGAHVSVFASRSSKEQSVPTFQTEVGSDGAFSFHGHRAFSLFMVMGDPISSWALVIDQDGQKYNGWSNSRIGYAERQLALACELADPEKQYIEGRGICRAAP